MTRRTFQFAQTLILSLLFSEALFSQAATSNTAPKTKLEEFQSSAGAVLVRSFSTIGEMAGPVMTGGGTLSLDAVEFFNAATAKRQFGIIIDVKEGSRSTDRSSRSLIDYEEIDTLLAGLDYIVKVDATAVKFERFQADYRTKDDFRVSVYSSGKDIKAAIASGRVGTATAYYNLQDLAKFRAMVTQAKTKIEAVMK